MAKTVASTLVSILDNPVMQAIQDRNFEVEALAKQILKDWSMDLYTRKPGPAVNAHGEFVGTDLDLATFMCSLAQRKAVIVLPTYERMRAATKREGERHLPGPRNGSIISLYSNQEAFSFGVRINDMSVISQDKNGTDTQGAPRNFALVNVKGEWHDGWKTIEFSPTAKENDFLNENQVWTGTTYVVKYFIHPNRWASFYGHPYFLAKSMVARLKEEAKHYRKEISRLLAAGVQYPVSGKGAQKEWPQVEATSPSEPISVDAMEVELDLPEKSGEYPTLRNSVQDLVTFTERERYWTYTLIPSLNFAVRGVEYAFFKHGFKDESRLEEKIPGWIRNAKWERKFRFPRKRNEWNRFILFQPAVGELGVSIRYRIFKKTERIAE
jgi:hypothetical protein